MTTDWQPSAVLFDFDGTLADSFPAIAASVNHVRSRHGLGPLSEAEVRRHVGWGAATLLGATVPAGDLEANLAAYKEHHPSVLASGTRLLPGAAELLAALAEADVATGVTSNKPRAFTVELLALLGLADRVGVVLGPEDVARPKPAPDMLLAALARLATPPRQGLYVGDMTVDIATARAAGVPVWVVATGVQGRDVLEAERPDGSFADLPAVHDRLIALDSFSRAEADNMRAWLRRLARPETALFVALWLGLLAAGRSQMLRDPGTFWHAAVGDRILATGTFPTTDEYSFTFAGQPWIAHQWLGEVALALLGWVRGLDAQLLAAVTILAGLWTWLGLRLMRAGLHWSLAVSLLALGIATSAGHFHVRPHLATMVLFAVLVAWLIDVEAGRVSLSRLAWLVPLFVLWTNLHGGMLGGLATLILALLGWALWRLLGWPSPLKGWREAGLVALLVVACAATSLVNPYGVAMPRTWLSILSMPELKRIIQEHAAPDWLGGDGLPLLGLGGLYVVLLGSTLPGRPRVAWGLPLVWLILSAERVRQAPLFAVAALLVIADLFPRTWFARRLTEKGSDLYTPPPETPPPAAPLWALALLLFVVALVLPVRYAQLDAERWPVGLHRELVEHQHDRGGGTRIFNAVNDGGYLIRYAPGYQIFVDDRCELYGGPWLADLVAHQGPEDLALWEARYGPFDAALVPAGGGFDEALRADPERWREVGRTAGHAFYVQRR